MSNLRDFTGKNRKFTGTTGITVSDTGSGPGDRVNEKGRLRFNDTTDLLEYYNGNDWKSIDAPPTITGFTLNDIGGSSVSSADIDNEDSGTSTIEILGSLFDLTGGSVSFVGNAETISPLTTTRNSANKFTVTVTNADFDLSNSPYTIKLTNGSGLSAELTGAISADSTTPSFTNAVDTTFVMYDSMRADGIAAADLCGASNADSFAVQTGSLPSGLSLNTTTGAITGTADAVSSDTTSTFTIRATGDDATADRQFKITVKQPIITSLTTTGPGTYTVPTGANKATVLVVAGGGSGGQSLGGGAGAGGMLEGTITVTPGSTIPYNVGAGGQGSPRSTYHSGFYGANSTFGPIPGPAVTATAIGGGYGTGHNGNNPSGGPPSSQGSPNVNIGGDGGSGGGTGSSDGPATQFRGGYGTQTDSGGLTGYGNDGGRGGVGNPQGNHSGAGGGGAGGTGGDTNQDGAGSGGDGGIGRVSTISGSPVYYAGGGGGSPYHSGPHPQSPGAGGSGGGTAGVSSPNGVSSNGGTNTGGGSGAGAHPGGGSGTGGPGVIIVKV